MPSLNKVMLIGNIGQDPTFRQTSRGQVMSFSLATSRGRESKTEWHRITLFEPMSNTMAFLRRGLQVYVEGYLTYSEYQGQDGVKRSATDIVATHALCLTTKNQASGLDSRTRADYGEYVAFDQSPRNGAANDNRSQPRNAAREPDPRLISDDDLPF